jgi:electron transfer flavoprotein alpha subunit
MATKALTGEISELRHARDIRLKAGRAIPMNERLARVHRLCKQMSAIKGATRAR